MTASRYFLSLVLILCCANTNFAMLNRLKEFAIDYSPFHFSHTSPDFRNLSDRSVGVKLELTNFQEASVFITKVLLGIVWPLWCSRSVSEDISCGTVKLLSLLAGGLLGIGGGIRLIAQCDASSHASLQFMNAIRKHATKKMLAGVGVGLVNCAIIYTHGQMDECLSF